MKHPLTNEAISKWIHSDLLLFLLGNEAVASSALEATAAVKLRTSAQGALQPWEQTPHHLQILPRQQPHSGKHSSSTGLGKQSCDCQCMHWGSPTHPAELRLPSRLAPAHQFVSRSS